MDGGAISVCPCGFEIPMCNGCGREINVAADGCGSSGSYGRLCMACFDTVTRKHGRTCNKCIRAYRQKFPTARVGWLNDHPLKHSDIVGHCVDRDLVHFLEGFNRNVAPTFSSCQGDLALPGTKRKWTLDGLPFVSCLGKHGDAVMSWVRDNAERYGVVEIKWQRPLTLAMSFSGIPTWLD